MFHALPLVFALAAAPTPDARLQGQFLLAGRVAVAAHVPGEHVGQVVSRTWSFTPGCPAGPCATVTLVRTRASGVDTVTLYRRGPGYYAGSGSFFAPLRCAGRTYPNGAAVPFTITVRVTRTLPAPWPLLASRVSATYVNRSRQNLTPCVAVLGHDAATYHGYVLTAQPPTA
jgi:hypothetical protein